MLGALLALASGACREPDGDGETTELRQPVGSALDASLCPPAADAGSQVDAGPDAGPTPPDPAQSSGVKITQVTAAGAGCSTNQGTVKVALNPDGTNFVATFEKFAIGPGVKSQATSNCTLILDVEVPDGTEHALESFHVEGNAMLRAGDLATFDAKPTYTGQSNAPTQPRRIEGPFSGPIKLDEKLTTPTNFSKCARARQVQLRTFLTGKFGAESSIRIDKIGPVKFALRPCTP